VPETTSVGPKGYSFWPLALKLRGFTELSRACAELAFRVMGKAEPMFSARCGRHGTGFAIGAIVAVACATPAVAGHRGSSALGGPSEETPRARSTRVTTPLVTDADRAMGIQWRFDAGGPIHAAPAIGTDGAVYFGTAAGYLVALDVAGVVRWSYTLEGAVAWSPVVDETGRIYVATAAQKLYAFQASGVLGWQVRTPVHIGGELVLAVPSGVLFGGVDGSVWAYAPHGSPEWHAVVGAAISAGPKTFGGRTIVASADGTLLELAGAMRKRTFHVEERCDSIVTSSSDGSLVVVAGGALIGLGPNGEARFRRAGVAWADVAGDGFVAVGSGRIMRLDATGAVLTSTHFDGVASAPPAVAPSGDVYVPEASGAVSIVAKKGVVRRVPVAIAALHRPVFDLARRRVLLTAGNGIDASLRLED